MSCDLIYAWSTNTQGLHTAIDDLESFIWVLLWTVLSILKSKGVLKDAHEQHLLFTMCSHKLSELQNREGILVRLQKRRHFSKGFSPFSHLLIQWLEIAQRSAVKVAQFPASNPQLFKKYCTDIYKEYIEAGLESLSWLPQSWEYFKEHS
ncbi:hypothetical protein K439DRAFT_565447 [Ramaria rubella]|nr:hypothetical protein K439DRAFT_565447 [Ramaria rubella]